MIEKVLLGGSMEVLNSGNCVCGCTCPYGDIQRAIDRGDSAADWDYAEEQV